MAMTWIAALTAMHRAMLRHHGRDRHGAATRAVTARSGNVPVQHASALYLRAV
jgi:hypothetical protein